MKHYANILKEKGIRVTTQRIAVYKVLDEAKAHLTADQVYREVKEDMPSMSLATVYTILDLLKEEKMVRELSIYCNKSCYETRIDMHHHFYCRVCRNIVDVDLSPCKVFIKKEVDGNTIEDVQGYFYGICKNCRGGSQTLPK